MTKDQTPSREEVIRWAREAGLPSDELYHPNLERFAALIASRVAAAARAEEREAMVAEAAKQGWVMRNEDPFEDAVREIAAIRARGRA